MSWGAADWRGFWYSVDFAEGGGVRILTPAEIASVNAHHRSPHLAERALGAQVRLFG